MSSMGTQRDYDTRVYGGSLYESDGPHEELCAECGEVYPVSEMYAHGKHIFCERCLPTCDWVEAGEICGEVADPTGEGFCTRHEAVANSESEVA